MGMYTELVMAAEIKTKDPAVIDILQYMTDNDSYEKPKKLPDHPLFKTSRWSWMLNGTSEYFSGSPQSKLTVDTLLGTNNPRYFLSVRFNIKNYENEIEKFLDWLAPYLSVFDEFIGYYRSEEYRYPTLIFCTKGKIHYESCGKEDF